MYTLQMFSSIVITDIECGIGREGKMPWHFPKDMNFFKLITEGNIVVMSRKTWESLFRWPLPGRINVVVSRQQDYTINEENTFLFNDLETCVRTIAGAENKEWRARRKGKRIFIIGGAEIYRQCWNMRIVNDIYHTKINSSYNCDVTYPIPFGDLFYDAKESRALSSDLDMSHYYQHTPESNVIKFMKNILAEGLDQTERTGTGALSIFGADFVFDMHNNVFPLGTMRRTNLRLIFEELMMNIRGITDSKILEEKGYNIWKPNSCRKFLDSRGLYHFPEGVIGESYGFQMRNFGGKYDVSRARSGGHYTGFDQLEYVLNEIRNNPTSRRLIITLWNPQSLNNCALPACACWYEFYVNTVASELSMKLVQRSSDIAVAGAHNIAYAALFLRLVASVSDLSPAKLIWSPGNVHIYKNNIDNVRGQLDRLPNIYPLLYIDDNVKDIASFTYYDLELVNYKSCGRGGKLEINA